MTKAVAVPTTSKPGVAAPTGPIGPDAELLHLCTEWRANLDAATRLMDLAEEAQNKTGYDRLWAEARALTPLSLELRTRITWLRATTAQGLRAKVEVVAYQAENTDRDTQRIVDSFIRDALAMTASTQVPA